MLTVVAWKWKGGTVFHGNEYTAEHVNVLRSMVKRNLTIPHDFVCITDDPDGIDKDIRIIPLWDEFREHSECYVRLGIFDPDKNKGLGTILSIDLDCVILGRIDHLVTSDDFKVWKNPKDHTPYCGSMFMLREGTNAHVYRRFDIKKAEAARRKNGHCGSDQAWMSHLIPNAPAWNNGDGIYSFKWDIHPRETGDRWPGGARVVFFHGSPSGDWKHEDPSDPDLQKEYPWIAEHWR